jgi:hypothetical protein
VCFSPRGCAQLGQVPLERLTRWGGRRRFRHRERRLHQPPSVGPSLSGGATGSGGAGALVHRGVGARPEGGTALGGRSAISPWPPGHDAEVNGGELAVGAARAWMNRPKGHYAPPARPQPQVPGPARATRILDRTRELALGVSGARGRSAAPELLHQHPPAVGARDWSPPPLLAVLLAQLLGTRGSFWNGSQKSAPRGATPACPPRFHPAPPPSWR